MGAMKDIDYLLGLTSEQLLKLFIDTKYDAEKLRNVLKYLGLPTRDEYEPARLYPYAAWKIATNGRSMQHVEKTIENLRV